MITLVATPTTIHDFVRSRRSVRHFRPEPIARDVIDSILEAGTWAPNAHNRQPWRFAALTTSEAKANLADAMGKDFHRDMLADSLSPEKADSIVQRSQDRIQHAPVVIVLFLTMRVMDVYPDERRQRYEYMMAAQSVALAGGNMLLVAHAEGLGGVWVCAPLFAQETVRKSLELPCGWEAQGLLLLGYPVKIPQPRPRRPIEEIVRFL